MKKTLLHLGRLAACTSLLFGSLTSGYAQERKAIAQPFKATTDLRELTTSSRTTARTLTVGGGQ